jgi:hypothetical protein
MVRRRWKDPAPSAVQKTKVPEGVAEDEGVAAVEGDSWLDED